MQQLDLGDVDGPIVLFGGPYSNLPATQALLAEAERLNARHLICTGDVVAYAAQAAETVALIRASGAHVVAGNCEKQLAAGADDCGCGFEDGSACDLLSGSWYAHANAQIGSDDRAWMGQVPDIVTFTYAGKRYGVIHGGVHDIARFLWPTSPEAELSEEWQAAEAITGPLDVIIAGHSGISFQRDIAQGRWINAGVIGMPPHDGAPETRYAVLQDGQCTIHTLQYDWQAAQTAMRAAGLIQGYDHALETGYWPSEDVLPSDLRVPSLANG